MKSKILMLVAVLMLTFGCSKKTEPVEEVPIDSVVIDSAYVDSVPSLLDSLLKTDSTAGK